MANDEYLGDGVYASFDGYQIWLAANHHENKVIALELDVIYRLLKYANGLGGNAFLQAAIERMAKDLEATNES